MIGAVDVDVVSMLSEATQLQADGQHQEAEGLIREALQISPGYPDALARLADIAVKGQRSADALEIIDRALLQLPHRADFHFLHAVASMQAGDLDRALAAIRRGIRRDPGNVQLWTNLIFCLDLHPSTTWQDALAARAQFDEAFCKPHMPADPTWPNDRDPDRKLRVGYVGGDFRAHSAAAAFGCIVLNHSDEFMVFTYHTGPSLDQGSVPYVQHTWCRGVNHLSAQQLDERIRQDRIDILVDLAGYSAGGALQTFAMRPAPVSVTAWGYLTGLGLSCIDYIFADEVTIPRDHGERYTENIVHLPSAMAYNPEPYLPSIRPPPELENGYRTYGYLGRANKITASCFDAWARILHARPDARLILKSGAYSDREQAYRVTNALVARGVEQERIDLRPQTHKLAHAEAHHDVDVCLDVAPQNGGITTLDALWMGCPVVTLAGERLPGRIGASVNTLAQRTQDIALTWEDYIARAVSMPVSLDERVAIRAAVRDSALIDHKRLVKAVEEAYRVIWRRYVNSASEVAA